jgi:putative transposase
MGRCVRRAFLCGEDNQTGKDFSHRKVWITDRLKVLAKSFTIDVCAYAVMSNHYHLVLKINDEKAKLMSDDEVIERWMVLFSGDVLVQRYLKGDCKTQAEKDKVKEIIELWRDRLCDISWFMRCLNEPIARQANAEDKCTGRFWEGRFKSQALLNEQAVLSCMVYVDLNPIRATLADNLEDSDYTSIQQRITAYSNHISKDKEKVINKSKPIMLAGFSNGANTRKGIPYSLKDYFELADWTGRTIIKGKRGYIAEQVPKIICKLGVDSDLWLDTVLEYSESYHAFVGSEKQLNDICKITGKKWLAGIKNSRALYG